MIAKRLDVLIYAHDGRGLGHASRSIGIGLALRRLFPRLKVLFVSGCRFSQEMIGDAPLDWLKLPSYKTQVIEGKSEGVVGDSMFSDRELGLLRSRNLAHYVQLYKPRVILADHTPQGKHKELAYALAVNDTLPEGEKSRWVLGVRGVVGGVPQATSSKAVQLFGAYYSGLLWYGDSNILGKEHCQKLEEQYGVSPVECGYVLRLAEFCYFNFKQGSPGEIKKYAGVISIPWLGEHGLKFAATLAAALKKITPSAGIWRIFIDMGESRRAGSEVMALFGGMKNCQLEMPSGQYASALLGAKTAIVYGGYNSLMDVLHAGVPSLVVLREMKDAEQQIHLQSLQKVLGKSMSVVSESEVAVEALVSLLQANLNDATLPHHNINLDGAVAAAKYIQSKLGRD